jgi:hydrogenase expression/formation protein HypD
VMEPEALEAFRDPTLAKALAREIQTIPVARPLTLMHVCGTHEHAIGRAGLRSLLPRGVRLVAGPGCPVCVCPAGDIDRAIEAARKEGVTLATFGDMVRVPASAGSLEQARAEGLDVRVVYSPMDAVRLASEHPQREVIFMAVGFETTAAPIAAALAEELPRNFSILSSLRLIPPALRFLLAGNARTLDGFILPGHVSVISGREGYQFLESEYGVPAVIAGFEPLDILRAVRELLLQSARGGRGTVVNLYRRAVHDEGNAKAREVIHRFFDAGDASWRGIGTIPDSGLLLWPRHEHLDAAKRFDLPETTNAVDVRPGCQCHRVILGEVEPEECPLFGRECSPRRPHGPCMVSSEGTCRARFQYRAYGQV